MALIYPAGLGMGDVKLAAFLGAWLGRDVVRRARSSARSSERCSRSSCSAGAAADGPQVDAPVRAVLAAGGVVALFFGEPLLDAWLG